MNNHNSTIPIPPMFSLKKPPMPKQKMTPSRPCITSHPSSPVSPDNSVDTDRNSQSFSSHPSPSGKLRRPRRERRTVRRCLFPADEKENTPPGFSQTVLGVWFREIHELYSTLKLDQVPGDLVGINEARDETAVGLTTTVQDIIKGRLIFWL